MQRSSVLPDSECASWGSGELGMSRASNGNIDDLGDATGDTSDRGGTVGTWSEQAAVEVEYQSVTVPE
jgi:hypothetical protein